MGILRLILALSVLIFHSGSLFNYNIANPKIAVCSFFVISGFYMALILDKKYKAKNAKFLFWSNRALRIFPVYWITLATLLILALLKFYFHIGTEDNAIVHYLTYAPKNSPAGFYFDLLNFIFRNITLIINIDYVRVNNSVPGYLLILQAWTLQIELLFYLIAPFISKLSKKLFVCLSALYIVVFFGIIVPTNLLPLNLTYQFLDNLIFFLLGVTAYKFIYKSKIFHSRWISPKLLNSLFIFFILYLLFYNYLPLKVPLIFLNLSDLIYFIVLTLIIPLIFFHTSKNKIDNYLGKLSYPVYITHLLLIKLLSNMKIFVHDSPLKTILVITSTLFVAYLMVRFIETPIDRYRQRRLKI